MKLYDGGLSILLGILLLGSVLSDKWGSHQDRKELKKQIDNSVVLSGQVVTLSSNVLQMSASLNTTIKEKGEVEKKYEKQLVEKDAKTGEQMAVLASQAQSIATSTPASDTIKHFNTAKMYMDLYGATIADTGLAWNTQYIKTQASDYEQIKAQLEVTKKENEKLQQNLEKTSTENVQLSGKLNEKAIDLEKTVGKVAVIEQTLYSQKGLMARFKQILFYAGILSIIGGLLYVGFHFWQIRAKNRDIEDIRNKLREEAERRRLANVDKYAAEAQAKELTSAVKTFFTVDPIGNETMSNILKANGLKKHFEEVIIKEEEKKST